MSEKTQVRRLIEGLQILEHYDKYGCFDVAHDIFIGPEGNPSDEDRKRLGELGWFESGEYDCWCMFT